MEMEKVEGSPVEEKKELTANIHSVESFGMLMVLELDM